MVTVVVAVVIMYLPLEAVKVMAVALDERDRAPAVRNTYDAALIVVPRA